MGGIVITTGKYWLDDATAVICVEGLHDEDGDSCSLEIEQHKDTGKIYVGLCYDDDRVQLFYGNACEGGLVKIDGCEHGTL